MNIFKNATCYFNCNYHFDVRSQKTNGSALTGYHLLISGTCGGTYIGQKGVIQSPGFPQSNYPDSSSCEWYLEGPTGHYLTLSYGNFSLQPSSECSADFVEIREYNASGKNKCEFSSATLILLVELYTQKTQTKTL